MKEEGEKARKKHEEVEILELLLKASASQGHLNQLTPDTLTHPHILKTSTNIF